MGAYVQNLVIEQGATFSQAFVWQDENGNPIDLSAYTAHMQVRAWPEVSTIILDLTSGGGQITLDALGNIVVTVDATATGALGFASAVYDLLLINGAVITRLVMGRVSLSKSTTR